MNISGRNYDSEFCGSLPLHNINLIQPYGYLVVLNKQNLSIIQVSENASEILLVNTKELIGHDFTSFLEPSDKARFSEKLSSGNAEKIPLNFEVNSLKCTAIAHIKPEFIILEIEQFTSHRSFVDVYQELKVVIDKLNLTDDIEEISELAVAELRRLSGFDKVMMYKFDQNWNGTVIAEASAETLDSYLGLTFPASDIPKQARQLYLKNPYRLIPTRDYKPIRLYPVRNPVTNAFIDLSDCNLRSVPAVHLEYLSNMKVMASMSTRIIVDDKLWGLISCHHREEKKMSYEDCSMFELLSDVISAKIAALENKERFDKLNTLREGRSKIVDSIYAQNGIVNGLLFSETSILELFAAGGAAIVQKTGIHALGSVPADGEIRGLSLWLQNKMTSSSIFSESNLAGDYDDASKYARLGSGILAIPIDNNSEEFIILFRPEAVTTINWGGNPEDAITFEPDQKQYHPRNSFHLWKETVLETSLPWDGDEIHTAEEIKRFIFGYSANFLTTSRQ